MPSAASGSGSPTWRWPSKSHGSTPLRIGLIVDGPVRSGGSGVLGGVVVQLCRTGVGTCGGDGHHGGPSRPSAVSTGKRVRRSLGINWLRSGTCYGAFTPPASGCPTPGTGMVGVTLVRPIPPADT